MFYPDCSRIMSNPAAGCPQIAGENRPYRNQSRMSLYRLRVLPESRQLRSCHNRLCPESFRTRARFGKSEQCEAEGLVCPGFPRSGCGLSRLFENSEFTLITCRGTGWLFSKLMQISELCGGRRYVSYLYDLYDS